MQHLRMILVAGAFGLSLAACGGKNVSTVPVSGQSTATQYTQIELLARPAVKELFEKFVDHQITNATEPYNDPTLQGEIQSFTDALRPPKGGADYGKVLASVLYPNEITADLSQTGAAAYLGNETGGATSATKSTFGGRAVTDDVIDISLGAVFGKTLPTLGLVADDGQENNCISAQKRRAETDANADGDVPLPRGSALTAVRIPFLGLVAVALVAIAALAVWPRHVETSANSARAAALPTMAPVTPDYLQRDKLVAFWERATKEHHRGDMISPRMLAEQYLQRYRERYDVDDVLRAERATELSLQAQPRGNLAANLQLASIQLTLHRFYAALATTKGVERWDAGDPSMYAREASLDLEVGDYTTAARKLAAVPERDRDDEWSVVESRDLELTGHLDAARNLLANAAAYQNGNFDAPAQQRAWYFFRQGEMAFEAGDNDGALALEREALAVFPNDADAGRTLARIECSLHQWAPCLHDAAQSAAIVPYPETLGYEADAQRALGQTVAAAQTDDLIATVERLGDAYHITDRLTAVYYSEHGTHRGEAYAIARNELHSRDDVFTEDTLAWAAAMDGRWSEARTAIAKAQRWHTQNALIDYHAGVIAEHFGDLPAAKTDFNAALALNPHFHPAYADDARQRLAAL